MLFLLFLASFAICTALWLVWHIVKYIPWQVTLWCFLLVTLLATVMSGELVVSPAERLVITLWSGSIVFLPLWWLILGFLRSRKG